MNTLNTFQLNNGKVKFALYNHSPFFLRLARVSGKKSKGSQEYT